MNYWKKVWDAYHRGATKRAYLGELWRISGWVTRAVLIASSLAFLWGLASVGNTPRHELPWTFICGEFGVLAAIHHMKNTTFRRVYGSVEQDLSPADDGDHQVGRFLMFKELLRKSQVTKSHVSDLFELLDAREGMESQRNGLVYRFLIFVSGFFTALAITLIRNLSFQVALKLLLWLIVVCACVGPVLWVLPSRREKLKELRYFMLLYCKSLAD